MKVNQKLNLAAVLFGLMAFTSQASTLMQYEIATMVSGSTPINGTIYFVSYGIDGALNSSIGSLSGSSSLIAGDDKWLFANSVADGYVQGNWVEQYSTGISAGQKIIAFFVNGLTSSDVNYTTGGLLNSKTIGAGGAGPTNLAWGSYRTDSVETLGGQVADAVSWTLPSNVGATASIIAYDGIGDFVGNDINASLATTGAFSLVPEPSTGALLMIGSVGLLALRRLRKV